MSKTTHTPGPWVAHKAPSVHGGNGFVIQGTPRGVTVAELFPGSSTDRIEQIAEANASLIAAAPDLLAACKAALAALSQPMTHPADIAASKKWLTDAAAKAEGRA